MPRTPPPRPLVAILLTLVAAPLAAETDYVTYESFGARGDGKANDLPAIQKAHQYANERLLPVRAKSGATYRIGVGGPAVIKTDTDFRDAVFLIDDSTLTVQEGQVNVFAVESDRDPWAVTVQAPLSPASTTIGTTLPARALLVVTDNTRRHFIRYGLNQNNGVPASDVLLVEKDGSLHPSTPPVWEFPQVTSAMAYSAEDRPITIRGGIFRTIANRAESKYTYHARGFFINRSNVTLEGMAHYVVGEGPSGAPYTGFFFFKNCYNCLLKDTRVTGHKTYSTIGSAGKPVTMGSYDLGAHRAVRLTFQNVTQTNSIHDTTKWGIMGTNFCRDLLLEGCTLSRFDAHQGVANVTIRNCALGYAGVNLIGYGTFLMENTWVHSRWMTHLRGDYGSTWDGNMVIRNCVLAPPKNSPHTGLVDGYNLGNHDFGHPCRMPATITVQGLKILDKTPKGAIPVFLFANFLPGREAKQGPIPYPLTGKVILRGVFTESGKPPRLSLHPTLFRNTQVLYQR